MPFGFFTKKTAETPKSPKKDAEGAVTFKKHAPESAELPTCFTEEDFNADLYILQSMEDDISDWCLRQRSDLDFQMDQVNSRLTKAVMKNHHILMDGMKHVQEVDMDLSRGTVFVTNCTHKLERAKKQLVHGCLDINRKARRMQRLKKVLEHLRVLKEIISAETKKEEALRANDFVCAINLCFESKARLHTPDALLFSVLNASRRRLVGALRSIRSKLDRQVTELCKSQAAMCDGDYSNIIHAYLLLDNAGVTPEEVTQELSEEISGRPRRNSSVDGSCLPSKSFGGIAGLTDRVKNGILDGLDDVFRKTVLSTLVKAREKWGSLEKCSPSQQKLVDLDSVPSAVKEAVLLSEKATATDGPLRVEYGDLCSALPCSLLLRALRDALSKVVVLLHKHAMLALWHVAPFASVSAPPSLTEVSEAVVKDCQNSMGTSALMIWDFVQRLVCQMLDASSIDDIGADAAMEVLSKAQQLFDLALEFGKLYTEQATSKMVQACIRANLKKCFEQAHRAMFDKIRRQTQREEWKPTRVSSGSLRKAVTQCRTALVTHSASFLAVQCLPLADPEWKNPFEDPAVERLFETAPVYAADNGGEDSAVEEAENEFLVARVIRRGVVKAIERYLRYIGLYPVLAGECFVALCQLLDVLLYSVMGWFLPKEAALRILQPLEHQALPEELSDGSVTPPPLVGKARWGIWGPAVSDLDGEDTEQWRFAKPLCMTTSFAVLHELLKRVRLELIGSSACSDGTDPLPAVLTLHPSTMTTLTDGETMFGLIWRCTGAESLHFIATLLQSFSSTLLPFLPRSQQASAETYTNSFIEASTQARCWMYRALPPLMFGSVVSMKDAIPAARCWKGSSVASECNKCVHDALQWAAEIWRLLQRETSGGNMTLLLRDVLWSHVQRSLLEDLMTGLGRVQSCTAEGRSQMSVDLNALITGVRQIRPVRLPCVGHCRESVQAYIGAFYFQREEDAQQWVSAHSSEYPLTEFCSLLTCGVGASMKKKKRLRLLRSVVEWISGDATE